MSNSQWSVTPVWTTVKNFDTGGYVVQYTRSLHMHPVFRHSPFKVIDTDESVVWTAGLPTGYAYDEKSYSIIPVTTAFPIQVPEPFEARVQAQPVFTPPSEKVPEVPFIDTNPKTAFGAVKPGSFQTPMVPFYEYSLAHYQGALKYGHYNWREDPVSISTYVEAARRHIDLFLEGQKEASDTGIHNLAHAMTCLSIVIDAEWYGTLIDDRSTFGNAQKMEEYFESKKAMRQKIAADWTGHAEKLKAKLNAKKG